MYSRKLTVSLLVGLVAIVLVYDPSTIAAGSNTTTEPFAAVREGDNSPRLVLEAGGHRALIRNLLFTADGRELVSVSDDKTIRVWSVSPDGRQAALVRTLRGQIEDDSAGQIFSAVLSPTDAKGLNTGLLLEDI